MQTIQALGIEGSTALHTYTITMRLVDLIFHDVTIVCWTGYILNDRSNRDGFSCRGSASKVTHGANAFSTL